MTRFEKSFDKATRARHDRFREGVKKFHQSAKTPNDYFEFVQASALVLRQGIALSWEEIMQILDEEIPHYDPHEDAKII